MIGPDGAPVLIAHHEKSGHSPQFEKVELSQTARRDFLDEVLPELN
ncbi:MAG TPA: hypothetical protein VGD71_16825 [Kribbella sp.]